MNKNIAKCILKVLGWKVIEPVAPDPKCIILGAPHTSIWDFPIALLYYEAVGGKASCMIKGAFFRWPLGPILRSFGGIPVKSTRVGKANLVTESINAFKENEFIHLAMAPEGTRKPVERWKTGFHKIATGANVPVYLGYFDWKTKTVGRGEKIELTDDPTADLKRIRQWYKDKGVVGRHPKNFITGNDLI